MEKETIKKNIESVREQMEAAARTSGRKAEDVTLMAVSKTYDIEHVIFAREQCSVTCFGENRAQEIEQKFDAYLIPDQLHMIGHLQSNKVKKVLPFVSSIDSVDSFKLLEKIDRAAAARKSAVEVLFEFNTSGEDAKAGFTSVDELMACVEKGLELEYVTMKGLMTIGPLTDDRKRIRMAFSQLRELYYQVIKAYPEVAFDTISMGMSGDFDIAIEEGSTLVRVGSKIFGSRNYG
jgi:pyridoxal phosphate enzyme (YggS family)